MARPRRKLSEDELKNVAVLAGCGIPYEVIARRIGVSLQVLRREAKTVLEDARANCIADAATCLYRMATNGRNLAATIFFLKTRGGWRESVEHHHHSHANLEAVGDDALAKAERVLADAIGSRTPSGD